MIIEALYHILLESKDYTMLNYLDENFKVHNCTIPQMRGIFLNEGLYDLVQGKSDLFNKHILPGIEQQRREQANIVRSADGIINAGSLDDQNDNSDEDDIVSTKDQDVFETEVKAPVELQEQRNLEKSEKSLKRPKKPTSSTLPGPPLRRSLRLQKQQVMTVKL